MGAVQLNTRIDEELKARGDAVLADYGVSSTDAIRSLWSHLAETGTLPDFIAPEKPGHRPKPGSAEEGAGIAIRVMREMGYEVKLPPITDMDAHVEELKRLRDRAYQEELDEILDMNAHAVEDSAREQARSHA